MNDHQTKPLLTVNDLMDRWECSRSWLAAMRSEGTGPAFVKLSGNAVRYRLQDVEAYEAARLSVVA